MQQRVSFIGRDGQTIAGVIHTPDSSETLAYALFAHCFTCTKNINSAVTIASALAEEGIATLRFDFTGLGSSGGDFSDTSFTTNVQDLIDAAHFLEEAFEAPQILVGHSLGGTAILSAAHFIDSAKAVATIGSPASPEHVLHHLQHEIETIEEEGQADVTLVGRTFTFKKSFIEDIQAQHLDIHNLRKALMIMHSPIDDTVSVEQATKIYQQALHPKSFISLDNADHLLSKAEDSRYAGKVLASWARRYIDVPASQQVQENDDSVIASANTHQGFLNYINASGHKMIADEPKNYGGSNLGPTPYDFLAAALGSCTSMTLNMYARHKKLAVRNVTTRVTHDKVHAKDCEDCQTQNGFIHILKREITIDGDLTEEQRKRMLAIADKCPVHKTLEGEIKVDSRLL